VKLRNREALLSLGSNVDPHVHVPRALALLDARHDVRSVSPLYRTKAVGGRGAQPDFVNLAVRLRTDLPPRALREACRRTEDACGRRRTADRYAPRTMDIDVVLLDDLVMDLDTWALPDPALATQPFVLVPCADVWPEAVHPVRKETLDALRRAMGEEKRGALVPVVDLEREFGGAS
jgi:2-amino-4-hydroxy-6-hydroxymethyldihydropteridine diphosphokinase